MVVLLNSAIDVPGTSRMMQEIARIVSPRLDRLPNE